uniref:Zgc:172121 n=1 Tax=Astyanax mexicanus TaxID=7994 RepID=A0A8B9R818_ASTMX
RTWLVCSSVFMMLFDPLWSAKVLYTDPQAIKDVHYRFLQSGSDVITTATYQATLEGFFKHLKLKPEQAEELLISGVQIAKDTAALFTTNCTAADRAVPLVAGSVGPYGAFLNDGSEYTGNYQSQMSVEELKDWHRPQVRCLVAAEADLIALETIPCLKEVEALVGLLREFPNTKAWMSFSCKVPRPSTHSTAKSNVAGTNKCDVDVLSDADSVHYRLYIIQIHVLVLICVCINRWKSKRMSFTELSAEWKEQGALWIGGCCRTGPADITELRNRLI